MSVFGQVRKLILNFVNTVLIRCRYCNDSKFSDIYAWANSADPDQTVCHSVCIVWTHYSMVEPHSSNFRVIITNFLGVRIFTHLLRLSTSIAPI